MRIARAIPRFAGVYLATLVAAYIVMWLHVGDVRERSELHSAIRMWSLLALPFFVALLVEIRLRRRKRTQRQG